MNSTGQLTEIPDRETESEILRQESVESSMNILKHHRVLAAMVATLGGGIMWPPAAAAGPE
jgi:hypothetical protein